MTDGNTYAINRHLAEREAYDEQQDMEAELNNLRDEVDTLTAKLAEVTAERDDVQLTLDATWDANMRGAKIWQEITGNKNTLPDQSDLVVMLLTCLATETARAEAAEGKLAEEERISTMRGNIIEFDLTPALADAEAKLELLENEMSAVYLKGRSDVEAMLPRAYRAGVEAGAYLPNPTKENSSWTVCPEVLGNIRKDAGEWAVEAYLETVEAIVLATVRRIRALPTPTSAELLAQLTETG